MIDSEKVHVRYCGGCNPRYDRVALAREILEILKGDDYFLNSDQKDIELVMCGCQVACAYRREDRENPSAFKITTPSDVEGVLNCLKSIS